jgi:hypothetical protein
MIRETDTGSVGGRYGALSKAVAPACHYQPEAHGRGDDEQVPVEQPRIPAGEGGASAAVAFIASPM